MILFQVHSHNTLINQYMYTHVSWYETNIDPFRLIISLMYSRWSLENAHVADGSYSDDYVSFVVAL